MEADAGESTAMDTNLPDEHLEKDSKGADTLATKEEVVWGKTRRGGMFRVPTTHDVLTLFHPSYPKSHFDLLNLALLALQLWMFFSLPRHIAKRVFFVYFLFWRAAYDGGLGWLLTKQSKKKWIVRKIRELGWLDKEREPAIRAWIRAQLVGKMGEDYSFDKLPLEYNTWLLFRQVVDIILVNDFLSYCLFALSCFRVPESISVLVHIMRWIGGIALIAFNVWVKTEAHNVVKDYGWYWGDCFFQRGALVFDGVFELAPHPMYSVGYAGYYGLSLICGSYPVLFVSLAAHAAQFAFLVLFENPHIERLYGQRKPIAQRKPIVVLPKLKRLSTLGSSRFTIQDGIVSSTTGTEADTATETEVEPDTDSAYDYTKEGSPIPSSTPSTANGGHLIYTPWTPSGAAFPRNVSEHDLMNKYFRRDTVLLKKVDLLRANDFMLILILFYTVIFAFLPPLTHRGLLSLHFIHALGWIVFHTFGLGLLLRAQSQKKFLVRHFLKHYYYPQNDGGSGAIQEAFANWKSLYNLSMCMTYVSFVGLVWKTYSIPHDWAVGTELFRHTLGALLVGLHIWASMESFEALGVFGWFFGDFFMEDFPAQLEYSGIYRYLNNPEVIGGASFFGLALVSGSKLVISLSIIKHLSQWWFLSVVENPHMKKLYGDSLRKEAGFVKVIKSVATKNARLLESRAGKHGPRIKKVAKEMKGTIDKVFEDTAEAVEGFLAKSKPMFSEVVQDGRVLFRQSREKLVIPRIANDISSYDTTKYKINILSSNPEGPRRFHLGEPITVRWEAPPHHSRSDWIGIYRIGANTSSRITQTSSLGMWLPVHDEDWDGDFPLSSEKSNDPEKDCAGYVVFKGNTLPWQVGRYEVRYHHDGKYNAMSSDSPFEVYVDRPYTMDFFPVRECLIRIVTLCLDSDPSLIPLSAKTLECVDAEAMEGRDPDDFHFWSTHQAKRICAAIKQAFDVECAPEVVVANANVSALANRILISKEILTLY